MPRISVLVVNYCAGHWLATSLSALAAQTMEDFEAIIVDNASSDESVEAAKAQVDGDTRFSFHCLENNIGFAAANNVAATLATADLIALLNPDAIPASDWLEQLTSATLRYPRIAMFGSTQIKATELGRVDGCGDNYLFVGLPWRGGYGWPVAALPVSDQSVFAPCGAAALYRKEAFDLAGGFDSAFFCYIEDIDLAFRLRLMGHRCMQIRDATVHHVGDACTKSSSTVSQYYGVRNIVWCFVKNMPWPLLAVLLPLHVVAMGTLVIRSVLRGQGSTTARALIDAIRGLPWKRRWGVQARRTVSWWHIARALTWSPRLYMARSPASTRE